MRVQKEERVMWAKVIKESILEEMGLQQNREVFLDGKELCR